MGKTTKNFRQTRQSGTASSSARNYGKMQRSEGWHMKVLNYLKVRGKGGITK